MATTISDLLLKQLGTEKQDAASNNDAEYLPNALKDLTAAIRKSTKEHADASKHADAYSEQNLKQMASMFQQYQADIKETARIFKALHETEGSALKLAERTAKEGAKERARTEASARRDKAMDSVSERQAGERQSNWLDFIGAIGGQGFKETVGRFIKAGEQTDTDIAAVTEARYADRLAVAAEAREDEFAAADKDLMAAKAQYAAAMAELSEKEGKALYQILDKAAENSKGDKTPPEKYTPPTRPGAAIKPPLAAAVSEAVPAPAVNIPPISSEIIINVPEAGEAPIPEVRRPIPEFIPPPPDTVTPSGVSIAEPPGMEGPVPRIDTTEIPEKFSGVSNPPVVDIIPLVSAIEDVAASVRESAFPTPATPASIAEKPIFKEEPDLSATAKKPEAPPATIVSLPKENDGWEIAAATGLPPRQKSDSSVAQNVEVSPAAAPEKETPGANESKGIAEQYAAAEKTMDVAKGAAVLKEEAAVSAAFTAKEKVGTQEKGALVSAEEQAGIRSSNIMNMAVAPPAVILIAKVMDKFKGMFPIFEQTGNALIEMATAIPAVGITLGNELAAKIIFLGSEISDAIRITDNDLRERYEESNARVVKETGDLYGEENSMTRAEMFSRAQGARVEEEKGRATRTELAGGNFVVGATPKYTPPKADQPKPFTVENIPSTASGVTHNASGAEASAQRPSERPSPAAAAQPESSIGVVPVGASNRNIDEWR